MAINPEIALGFRPPQLAPLEIQSPLDRYQKMLTLRHLMQQGQLGQMNIEQTGLENERLRQAQQDEQNLGSWMRQNQGRPDLTASEIVANHPNPTGLKVATAWSAQQKANMEAQSAVITNRLNTLKAIDREMQGITDNETKAAALSNAVTNKWMTGEQAAPYLSMDVADPRWKDFTTRIQSQTMDGTQRDEAAIKAIELRIKQNTEGPVTESAIAEAEKKKLDAAQAQRASDAATVAAAFDQSPEAGAAVLATLAKDPKRAEPFKGVTTAAQARAVGLTAEQQAAGARATEQFELSKVGKTEPHPAPVQAQREAEWRLRLEQQNDPLGLLKAAPTPTTAAPAPGGTAPPGAAPAGSTPAVEVAGPGQEPKMIWIGPDGTKYTKPPAIAPSPKPTTAARPSYSPDLQGEAVLKAVPAPVAQQVKAISEGRMAIPSGQALRTPYWQQMMGLVGQYDPSFDVNNPGKRLATARDFASGKSAQQVNALNTVIGHMESLSSAAEKLNNTWSPAFNNIANFLSGQAGKPEVKNFESTKKAVVDELTRVWRGTGGSEGDIKTWSATLDAANSPAQLHGVIAEIGHLLESKLTALQDQYREGMGTIGEGRQLLAPNSRKALDRLEQKAGSGGSPQSYQHTATGPNGHKIGSNDGKTWFDLTTGKQLQ